LLLLLLCRYSASPWDEEALKIASC
jgi:hypothetical protein